jgi:cysteine desulfuration protein SufE
MPKLDGLTRDTLIESFTRINDWEARFDFLLDLAAQVPVLENADLTDENRIQGCVSEVWLKSTITQGEPRRLEFVANSDAQLVTGLIAILMVLYNGRTLEEVVRIDAGGVLKQMELDANLSPTRRNGLYAMVEHLRRQAKRVLQDAR